MKFTKEFNESPEFLNLNNFSFASENLFNDLFLSDFPDLAISNLLFLDSFYNTDSYITFTNYSCFFNIFDFSYYTSLKFFDKTSFSNNSLITFIDQIDDLGLYDNLENITSIYHYSIPNVKISYPEPFIASPSFMHSDLWFVHILLYQYWLWFFFIFLIVFFF